MPVKQTLAKFGITPDLDVTKFWWEVVKGAALAVAAIFSYFANEHASKNTAAIEKLKLAISQRAQQAELDIKAYELVEKTLSLDAAALHAHGPAAAAIVNALTI